MEAFYARNRVCFRYLLMKGGLQMNLLRVIICIGLAVQLTHCGDQGSSEREIKVARVENGVPKAEDGRIVLSSESPHKKTSVVIPAGWYKGRHLNNAHMAEIIMSQNKSIKGIFDFDIPTFLDLATSEVDSALGIFTLSFSVQDMSNNIFEGVKCRFETPLVPFVSKYFKLYYCQSDKVILYEPDLCGLWWGGCQKQPFLLPIDYVLQ